MVITQKIINILINRKVMKSLTIEEMTCIEGGSLLSFFDGLCTGIAIGDGVAALLGVAGVVTLGTGVVVSLAVISIGCGGYAIYRNS
jgi:hypothetical protein